MIKYLRFFLYLFLLTQIKGFAQQFDVNNFIKKTLQYDIDNEAANLAQQNSNADSYLRLAQLYDSNDMLIESISLYEKADSIYKINGNIDYHAYTLTCLYTAYHQIGQKANYDDLSEQIIEIHNKDLVKDDTIKIIIRSTVGQIYKNKGDYKNALNIYEELQTSEQDYYKNNPLNYHSLLYDLTVLHHELGEESQAYSYVKKLLDLSNSKSLPNGFLYDALFLEADILNKQGNPSLAIKNLEHYYNQIEKEFEYKGRKAIFYDTLSGLYIQVGDLRQSLYYSEKALNLYKEVFTEDSEHYGTCLLNTSETLGMLGEYEKGIELINSAIIIFLKHHNDELYYYALRKLASQMNQIDESKAKTYFFECLELSKKLYGENSNEYADNLISCNLNFTLNVTDEQIDNVKKGIEIKRKNENFNIFYIYNLDTLASMVFFKPEKDWQLIYDISNELLDRVRDYILLNFRHLSNIQRENLWKQVRDCLLGIERIVTDYIFWANENNDYVLMNNFSSLVYDARLLKKGLLLTSSQHLDNLIANSNDPMVKDITEQLQILNHPYNAENLDEEEKYQLQVTLNNLERNLIDIVSKDGDFIDFANLKWQDIQSVLIPGEVAIEFFSYPYKESQGYGAVWVSPGKMPFAFPLFNEEDLKECEIKGETIYNYNNDNLYKIIWSLFDLVPEIKNTHTIYFSTDGLLNLINIENLQDYNSELLSEKYNMVRLSSTRELLKKRKLSDKTTLAVLYGGLNYDADILKNPTPNNNKIIEKISSRYHGREPLRGNVSYLPNTLSEVNNISAILNPKNCICYIGDYGTEESIKNFVHNNTKILHFATHGFYFKNEDGLGVTYSDPYNNYFDGLLASTIVSLETSAMQSSGLLFSGSNFSRNKKIPDYLEDGILTAEEISQLNLRKVELVVMSACETGLGEVTEEGVFGLQRGFKIAGVDSILMSLWKVDDAATQMLMTSFYENLMSGQTKQQSLLNAQKTVREFPGYKDGRKYPYEDPKYWAAFILLDALN